MDGQAAAQLAANETGRLAQAGHSVLYRFLIVTQHREKHFGMSVVRRDLYFRDRNHPDARVFQFERDNLRQIALDLVRNAEAACRNGFAVFVL
jgi:hypothetical protein